MLCLSITDDKELEILNLTLIWIPLDNRLAFCCEMTIVFVAIYVV